MPRIGLLSDSHGRAGTTQRAVDLLCAQDADLLLHLGDVGTVEVIDALCAPGKDGTGQLEAHVVFGNTDWDTHTLQRYAQDLGITVDHPLGRLDLGDGGEVVFCHGHEQDCMDAALREQPHAPRYLCHGHTHRAADTRVGPTRIINPGALFRASTYTVALLDTETDTLTFHEVPDGNG